jgi:hypothetical protein
MAKDLIADMMRLFQAASPEKTTLELMRIERTARDLWGGQRTYICKVPIQGKVLGLAESLVAGRSLSEARSALGVHRRTCHRLLRRRWVSGY